MLRCDLLLHSYPLSIITFTLSFSKIFTYFVIVPLTSPEMTALVNKDEMSVKSYRECM